MEYKIKDMASFAAQWQHIKTQIASGLQRGEIVLKLGRKGRNSLTNKKLHAMFGDIRKGATIQLDGAEIPLSCYQSDVVKAFLVRWFDMEMTEGGEPLKKPGRSVVCPVTGDKMYVRPSTTEFTQKEAGQFVEWLYMFGATHGVTFSDTSLAVYAEYREFNIMMTFTHG